MEKIVMKISGEALKDSNSSISEEKLDIVYQSIKMLLDNNKSLILITGGGNIWRGRSHKNMDDNTKDSIGMLATVMNSLALRDYLTKNNIKSYLCGSFLIEGIVPKYNKEECLEHLNNNEVIIISGGVGLPFTTTDFACVQRALELKADYLLMGKNIDGIYDKDPKKYKDAVKYDELTFESFLDIQIKNGLSNQGVIDVNALSLLCAHKLKTILYKIDDKDAIKKIINKEKVGTIIKEQ